MRWLLVVGLGTAGVIAGCGSNDCSDTLTCAATADGSVGPDVGSADVGIESGSSSGSSSGSGSGSSSGSSGGSSGSEAGLDATTLDAVSDSPAEGSPDLCIGVTCTALDSCHVAGTCDPSTGLCSNPQDPTCVNPLVISQVQTRGASGASDEFVELYNRSPISVTFDATWTLEARSASVGLSACASATATVRYSGTGQVIASHAHILYASTGISEGTSPDGTYAVGIPDAASIVLRHDGAVADALCLTYNASTSSTLACPAAPYVCEGNPATNPHDDTSGTDQDISLERKPGGTGGNTQDTGDNATDFSSNSSPDPHDLASPPVP